MSDWRYWITYAGKVTADTEGQAKFAAVAVVQEDVEVLSRCSIVDIEGAPSWISKWRR